MHNEETNMNLVFVGHVDHGKSTVIGRMLADTNSLPEDKLEQIKKSWERNSKTFEYSFLIDALKDEQSQGITIDAARVFFKTEKRNYIILDAPGHIEFLKNMITGASHAEAAVLVIDAEEGIRENSRRHGYMLSMLGIKQIAVLVNKMDLVDYDENVYKEIVKEYKEFLDEINVETSVFLPVSGMKGDNITTKINRMTWHSGKSVVNVLDDFKSEKENEQKAFRMPVQDVYKFSRFGDNRRIVAGTIQSGSISVGDEVAFYPSGKKSTINSIEVFNSKSLTEISAPYAAGFTLSEQIYIKRGEMAVKCNEKKPEVSSKISVRLFWLGKNPLEYNKEYSLKIGTSKTPVKLESIKKILDAASLKYDDNKNQVHRHDVAQCTLKLTSPISFDTAENDSLTSRFVIIDEYEISGGGIIEKSLDHKQKNRDRVTIRNYKWEKSHIPIDIRAEQYGHKSAMVIITGKKDTGKKSIARALEKNLFFDGRIVYFLGIGNILYGVDADIIIVLNTNFLFFYDD
jgi:bifunctional enzyme CysN/CysC